MGDFDFGQFQQVYEYLINKLKEGGALTPEEQKVYDMLIGFANQGLNLTNTADFNSLYTAFNSLADEGTKREFERLYGTNFTQGPNGQISFSQPGSIIEAFQRRGLSVNDGPAMAALTQGLRDYMDTIARNKFSAMTNSYAAMTPIRAQNIQAATNAGNVASTAIGRRVPIVGPAIGAGRLGGGGEGGGGEGEPISIDTRGGQDKPDFWDKFGPALIGLLGTGALGIGGYLLKDWWNKKPAAVEGDVIDRNAEERPPGGGRDYPQLQNDPNYFNTPSITPMSWQGAPESPYNQQPDYLDMTQSGYNPYANQAQPQYQYGGYQQPDYIDMGASGYQPSYTNSYQSSGWDTSGYQWAPEQGTSYQGDYGYGAWDTGGDAWAPSSWGDESAGYWV